MQLRYVILVLVLSFFSCSHKLLNNQYSLKTPLLIMKRTACYGTCPQYQVSIYNNGYVKYEGLYFVDKIGCYYSSISANQINNIKDKINNVNFFSLDSIYNAPMTDVPSVILEVNLDSKSYQVVDRFNGPKSLKEFQKFIDFIINSIMKWDLCDIPIE